jgi:hypothetical protein
MTKDEALELALEALETELAVDMTNGAEVGEAAELMCEAITAIKQARALDKMADNAEELGLHYEPCCKDQTCPKCKPAAQPAPVRPIIGSYLEKDNAQFKFSDYESDGVHHNKPAVPDAFGTREGEHPQYIQGWNDCRQAMMEMMK